MSSWQSSGRPTVAKNCYSSVSKHLVGRLLYKPSAPVGRSECILLTDCTVRVCPELACRALQKCSRCPHGKAVVGRLWQRVATGQEASTWSADSFTALLHLSVGRNASCRPTGLKGYALIFASQLCRDEFGLLMAKQWSADCSKELLQLSIPAPGRPTSLKPFCSYRSVGMHPVGRLSIESMS